MISIRLVDDGRRFAVERWDKPTGGTRLEGRSFPIAEYGRANLLDYVHELTRAELRLDEPAAEPEPAA